MPRKASSTDALTIYLNEHSAAAPFPLLHKQGIVTAAAAAKTPAGMGDAVWTHARHTYAQLLEERFAVGWDKESQLDEVGLQRNVLPFACWYHS